MMTAKFSQASIEYFCLEFEARTSIEMSLALISMCIFYPVSEIVVDCIVKVRKVCSHMQKNLWKRRICSVIGHLVPLLC